MIHPTPASLPPPPPLPPLSRSQVRSACDHGAIPTPCPPQVAGGHAHLSHLQRRCPRNEAHPDFWDPAPPGAWYPSAPAPPYSRCPSRRRGTRGASACPPCPAAVDRWPCQCPDLHTRQGRAATQRPPRPPPRTEGRWSHPSLQRGTSNPDPGALTRLLWDPAQPSVALAPATRVRQGHGWRLGVGRFMPCRPAMGP